MLAPRGRNGLAVDSKSPARGWAAGSAVDILEGLLLQYLVPNLCVNQHSDGVNFVDRILWGFLPS